KVVGARAVAESIQVDMALGVAGEGVGAPRVEERLKAQLELGAVGSFHCLGIHGVLLVAARRSLAVTQDLHFTRHASGRLTSNAPRRFGRTELAQARQARNDRPIPGRSSGNRTHAWRPRGPSD